MPRGSWTEQAAIKLPTPTLPPLRTQARSGPFEWSRAERPHRLITSPCAPPALVESYRWWGWVVLLVGLAVVAWINPGQPPTRAEVAWFFVRELVRGLFRW